MLTMLIIVALCLLILFAFIFAPDEKTEMKIIVFCVCIIIALSVVTFIEQSCKPKPIDVYRNRTTLEITYRDSVAIDSTVVFKNRNYNK